MAQQVEAAFNSMRIPNPNAGGGAVWRVWLGEGGCLPVAVAGHSLGEHSALVAAGVLDLPMQLPVANAPGYAECSSRRKKMAAILGLEEHKLRSLCAGRPRRCGRSGEF